MVLVLLSSPQSAAEIAPDTPRSTVLVELVPLFERFADRYMESDGGNGSSDSHLVGTSYESAVTFLRSNDIQIWESYPAFVLANVTTADVRLLEGLGLGIWSLENRTMISKDTWQFDTRIGEPEIPEELRCGSNEPGDCGFVIVQFIGPIKSEWIRALNDRGGVPVRYLPNFAFIMKVPATFDKDLSSLPFVQWTGLYHPAYRIANEFFALAGNWSSPGDVVIEAVTEEVDALNTTLAADGVSIDDIYASGDRVLMAGRADFASIKRAAMTPGVLWIEPVHGAYIGNNQAVWVIQSGVSGSTPIHDRGLHGEGMVVTMMDTGLDINHGMFLDPEGDPVGPQHRKVLAYYVPSGGTGNGEDEVGHGSHVAGSALGDAIYCIRPDNCYYGTYNAYDGMAYLARIIVQDVCASEYCFPDNPTDAYQAALDAGSHIHTNSWGRIPLLRPAKYTWYDNYLDNFVRQNFYFLVLHLAGNEGGSGSQTLREESSAKNLLTVGATGNGNQANNIPDWSSRGGTGDARIKPTILAPGDGVTSAQAGGTYVTMSGTSMATPIAAGAAALVKQYFTQGYYPTGQAVAANGFLPSAALIRAVMINGAVEINGIGAYRTDQKYPNNDQGWGRINLENALYFAGDARRLFVVDHSIRGLSTGEWIEYPLQVNTGQPFEATLTWSDPGAAEACNPCLVNNLDLLVTDPSGNQYKGNVFSGMNPGQSTTGGAYDTRNVEEGVLRLSPSAGTWRVRVTATNVPSGPQDFALVVTGALVDPSDLQVSTWKDHSVLPASVVDSSGRTHMVWQDRVYDNYDIFYARLSAIGSLEIRKRIVGLGNEETDPAIAINPSNGEIWVVFRQAVPSSGTGGIFYFKSSDSGVTWQGPNWVSDVFDSTKDYGYPSIAIDKNGRKHVVMRNWRLSGGTEYENVQYAWTDLQTPQWPWDWTRSYVSPTYQHAQTACIDNPMIYDPNIGIGVDQGQLWDDLHVVYGADPVPECSGSWAGSTYIRYVRSTNRGASWGPEITIGTTRDVARPNALVMGGSQDIFVAWHDWSNAFDIYFSRSTNNGDSWTTPTAVLATSAWEVYPSLGFSSGVLALSWADNGYSNYEVFVRKSTNKGSSWGTIVRVTNDAAASYYPFVRLDATAANYLLSWADTRNNGNSWYDVYFKRLAV